VSIDTSLPRQHHVELYLRCHVVSDGRRATEEKLKLTANYV